MDPNEALRQAREALATYQDTTDRRAAEAAAGTLAERFEALDGWLSRGGFLPDAWTDRGVETARRAADGDDQAEERLSEEQAEIARWASPVQSWTEGGTR